MTPQAGILAEGKRHAYFMIFKFKPRFSPARILRTIRDIDLLANVIEKSDAESGLHCVFGFGSKAWDRMSPGKRPKGLHPFKAIRKGTRVAPSTGGDLFLHIASDRHDLNFELARKAANQLRPYVSSVEEVHGFRYLDSRDLTGFIDGTENPKGKGREEAAIIGPDDPDFAGGSYVAIQRYVHKLDKWEKLKTEDQEKVIGRTKSDSVALPEEKKPPTSHIGRVVIEENGEELQILRQSYPYGNSRESGLFFVAYTKSLGTFERMLSNMMGTSGDGLYDHLMGYTEARTGATFFIPSRELLSGISS